MIPRVKTVKHWPLKAGASGSNLRTCMVASRAGANRTFTGARPPLPGSPWPSTLHLGWVPLNVYWAIGTDIISYLTKVSSTLTCFLFFFFFLNTRIVVVYKVLTLLSKDWGNIQQLFPSSLQIKKDGYFYLNVKPHFDSIKHTVLAWPFARGKAKLGFCWVVVILMRNIHD